MHLLKLGPKNFINFNFGNYHYDCIPKIFDWLAGCCYHVQGFEVIELIVDVEHCLQVSCHGAPCSISITTFC